MMTVIQNALVANSDCSSFSAEDLVLCDGRIDKRVPRGTSVPEGAQVIDAAGRYVLPGLIDIHTHGAMGVNFPARDPFDKALEYFAGKGVTTVLPTTGMSTIEKTVEFIEHVLREQTEEYGARVGGFHLEGPFLSEQKRGAMRGEAVACTVENFRTLLEAGRGQLRVMTIAPERENALEVIALGRQSGVRMSLGHTNATYEQAMAGIDAGAEGATHTFNAMRSLMHRDPGVLGAVLTQNRISCEAICDLVHLAPATVQLILAAKGADRMILISDSGVIAGLGDGDYPDSTGESGKTRYVRNGVSRLADGTISCSTCTMAEGARNLIGLGCSLLDIAKMGARNPARAAGLTDRGEIREGLLADLIIVDEWMNLFDVVLRGERFESAC